MLRVANTPMTFETKTSTMSIPAKILKCSGNYIFEIAYYYLVEPLYDNLRKRTGFSYGSLELMRRIQLIILPYDPVLEYPQSLSSNMVASGIWTNKPAKSLPNSLDKFVSSSSGFILMSPGSAYSFLGTKNKKEHLAAFISMLKILQLKIVLIGSRDDYGYNLPSNVFIPNISPNDILAHQSSKLFTTHCGILSIYRTMENG